MLVESENHTALQNSENTEFTIILVYSRLSQATSFGVSRSSEVFNYHPAGPTTVRRHIKLRI